MTLHTLTCQRLLISLAFSLVMATCLPAFAGEQPASEGPSTIVKIRDLNLNTDAGRRELLDRLSKAADRVCREYASASANLTFGFAHVYGPCFRSSLAAAVEKIHHEQLSALFAATSLRASAPGGRLF
jgi:UrcA family protein